MSTNKRTIDWYNKNAKQYSQHVLNPDDSVYHSLYEKPAMHKLLPNLKGKTVLSLGCGSGEDCHYLAEHGASKVVGIDISKNLIAIAKRSYPECQFQVMDMEDLAFEDASFDFAYSSLAIHYIEDWSKTFSEVYRILKPSSYFLFSTDHPAASAMETLQDDNKMKVQRLSLVTNRQTNKITIEGNYMNRRILEGKWGFAITAWHKPLGEICSEATNAGFVIANIVEPKPLPKMKQVSPKDYEILIKIPGFIIFKLLKVCL